MIMNRRLTTLLAAPILAAGMALTGCSSDADVASHNLSRDADNFRVPRQIVVYDLITDAYVLEVDGYCSLGNDDGPREVTYTCKIGGTENNPEVVKDIIRMGDNSMVFAHQLKPTQVSADHYQVILKPKSINPDVKVH
jgi:hypothetical protein